jgi:DNA replication protein DnaC
VIHIQGNEFVPGSITPKFSPNVGTFDMPDYAQGDMDRYLAQRLWEDGKNFLIRGGPYTGKTAVGLYLMRLIYKAEPTLTNMIYWNEADFIADMRNGWRYDKLVEGSPKDSGLWAESLEWERTFWEYKEAPILFMDDVGKAKTNNQRYELEVMLRRRKDMGYGTFVAMNDDDWVDAPKSLRSLFDDGRSISVVMEDKINAGQ